ncbi:MAG: DUF47 family protein [Actinobacteria bacterium]|nr:DUF47 family protein [Actinomycetota bacterium]
MGIKNLFKRKEDKFLKLLIKQAEATLQGMQALEKFMTEKGEGNADEVNKKEKEADEIRRILIDELLKTFITPIDREDIYALSRAIDDVIDYAFSTVDEMSILDVEPNNYLQEMATLLKMAANEIHLGVMRLEKNPGVASTHAYRAKSLENKVEKVYREAISDLFHGPKDVEHIVEMLKLREVYRHLSNAADRGDEAANIIADIVVKMT